MTITLLWYHIPTLLSILALIAAIWWPNEQEYGMFEGVVILLRLVPALLFICVVWIVAAVIK